MNALHRSLRICNIVLLLALLGYPSAIFSGAKQVLAAYAKFQKTFAPIRAVILFLPPLVLLASEVPVIRFKFKNGVSWAEARNTVRTEAFSNMSNEILWSTIVFALLVHG